MSGFGKTLVTGASGFIGARLVEALTAAGASVRAAASNEASAARLRAKKSAEAVVADLADPASMARAAEGCATIFHVAYRFGGRQAAQAAVNIEGTRALAEAAARNGARRFVHFSSFAAQGPWRDGDLVEFASPPPGADAYAVVKQKIDAMLLGMAKASKLPVAILQPTIVYGPRGGAWTKRPLHQVKNSRVALPRAGQGLCNAVFIDDVVSAALLAAERDEAVGDVFLISGAAPVTWLDFYRAYAAMTRRVSVFPLDDADFDAEEARRYGSNALLRKIRRRVEADARLRKFAGPLLPRDPAGTPPLYLPDPGTRALYSAETHVRVDKARRLLGYEPAFDLARGMDATARWARAAGLL